MLGEMGKMAARHPSYVQNTDSDSVPVSSVVILRASCISARKTVV
jgi:hypothetical protein